MEIFLDLDTALWLLPVLQYSCQSRTVVAGCILFLEYLCCVGWFWPILYDSDRFWHDLWIDFWRSALILILHDGYS